METVNTNHRHVICWRSAFAGLALALVLGAGLLALGVAFGGIALSDGTTLKRLSTLAAASLVFAVLIPTFAGAYYSVRAARQRVDLVGVAQGALVGSLFLLIGLNAGTAAVGNILKAGGTVIAGAAAGAGEAANNPAVMDVIEDATGDMKFKSSPDVVAKGLASRLLRGDQESARNYLAYQASISPQEADQKIAVVKAKADAAVVKAREATADAMKASGWTVFLLVAMGLMASSMGGYVATHSNERFLIDVAHDEEIRDRDLRARHVA